MTQTTFNNVELPAYEASSEKTVQVEEKSVTHEQCEVHGVSPTPVIDSQLQQPSVKATMLALSKALADAANDEGCTKCATESGARALTAMMRDLHAAKKSGQWSREEKKAFKGEAKTLFKGMKGDMKEMWKSERAGVAAA